MNEKIEVFENEDSYEDDKIIGFFYLQNDGSQFVLDINNINNNEIIIKLKDNSCHVAVMKDYKNAIKINNFFKEILIGKKTVKKIENFLKVKN